MYSNQIEMVSQTPIARDDHLVTIFGIKPVRL